MKFIKSLRYALQGIRYCILRERNFRFQLCAALIAIAASFYFRINPGEWIAVIMCCVLVLTLELINSSIESLSNIVTESYSPVIKNVKDIAAGAVLLTSIASLIIGSIIFIPYIKHLLHR